MMLRRALSLAIVAVCVTAHGHADELTPSQICNLSLLASLDVETTPEGMILVPATIDGHKGSFLVDTGGLAGVLGRATAKQLTNSPYTSSFAGVLTGGATLSAGITVDRFELGPLVFEKVGFLVAPDRMLGGDQMGVLQPRAITGLNYEIDFAKGKLNLFRQGVCPGHEVFWTKAAYAKIPMRADPRGHIRVEAVLDGKPLSVLIDTGAQSSSMSLKTAKRVFNIDERTPDTKLVGHVSVNNLVSGTAYRYPFSSLTFGGIAIDRPDIVIMDTGKSDADDAEMVVGIGELRRFHIFIAYDENAVYFAPAEAY